jgi:hypothetical protein
MSALQTSLDRILSNPLLYGLPRQFAPLDLAQKLRHRPINPTDVGAMPFEMRHLAINEYKKIFITTTQNLAITHSLQRMIHDSLAQRDPRDAAARRFIYESGRLKGEPLPNDMWWPSFASGMVIEGITGTGKSQVIDRFLSLYPQVVEHGPNPDCGWQHLKQLVWLKVHMPSDGSRGGFLLNGLLEMDRVLGTDYAIQYKSLAWTVEKLLVIFLHLLSVHRCGLLVIEEAQESNLSQSKFGRDFIAFFLRVLNWGVPTVLMGNPLAFTHIRGFSQNVDRFSEGGWFHLDPLMDHQSDAWKKDWIPGLWNPTLLDDPDEPYLPATPHPMDATLEGFIWRRTAGVPRYVCRLRREVQDYALRKGATRITTAMVEKVYSSNEKMLVLHDRIDSLVNKDWRALQRFDDIPSDYFRKLWAPPPHDDDDDKKSTSKTPSGKQQHARAGSNQTKAIRETRTPKSKEFQDAMIRDITKAAGLGDV